MCSPSMTDSPIGTRGSSEAYGSWKMICMSRRMAFSSLRLQREDILAVETDRTASRLDQAEHGAPDGGLAAAGFAHQAQRFALF